MSEAHDASALKPYSEGYELIPLTGPTELLKGKPGGKHLHDEKDPADQGMVKPSHP